MKLSEIKAKSIITKSQLNCDYCVNPYVGCMHGCIYCYARFMKRFTGHPEEWGRFVDAKVNAAELVRQSEKYRGKEIFFSSVTDPYQPVESRYKLTHNVLEKLIPIQPTIAIQSKSDLLVRDIDVFKKFKNIDVGISLSTLDESTQKKIEPRASSPQRRIDALMKLKKAGIHTHVFISPILPEITDWKAIIKATKKYADEIWFENLNLYPSIKANIYKFLEQVDPNLVDKYKEIYAKDGMYWNKVEDEIKQFCKDEKLNCKIYFHHTRR